LSLWSCNLGAANIRLPSWWARCPFWEGILGGGFSDVLQRRRCQRKAKELRDRLRKAALAARITGAFGGARAWQQDMGTDHEEAKEPREDKAVGDGSFQGRVFDFIQANTAAGAAFEYFIFALILANVAAFMTGTISSLEPLILEGSGALWFFEAASVVIFSVEYCLRFFAAGQNARYAGVCGRFRFVISFYSMVDLTSIIPFYVEYALPGEQRGSTFMRSLRLLHLLKGDNYAQAFTVFDDVIRANLEVWTFVMPCRAAAALSIASFPFYLPIPIQLQQTTSFHCFPWRSCSALPDPSLSSHGYLPLRGCTSHTWVRDCL